MGFAKRLAKLMKEVPEARPDRDFLQLPDGDDGPYFWVINITGCIYKDESQDSKEWAIMEGEVASTTHPDYQEGQLVKQMWAFLGVPKYRIENNTGIIKQILRSLLDIKEATPEEIDAALDGDDKSTLVGHKLKVTAKRQVSSNDKAYTKFTYSKPSAKDLAAIAKEETTETAISEENPTSKEEDESTPEVVTVSLDSDDEPAF